MSNMRNLQAKHQSKALKQRGFVAALLMVMMAIAAVAALTANLWGNGDPKAYERKITRLALQQAKEALLAHVELGGATNYTSALAGNAAGPAAVGAAAARLACTDLNGDGAETASCGTVVAGIGATIHSLGLFPWRTVGIPTPRDGADECLWYAVSGAFKNNNSTALINGDNSGQFSVIQPVKSINPITGIVTWTERLLVGDTSAAAVSPARAVAVIIAPGAAFRNQNRRPLASSRDCPLPLAIGGIPDAETSTVRYLESYAGAISGNNALIAAPANGQKIWVQADEDREQLNDELIWITAEEFANAVAKRTLRLYKAAIDGYVHGYYDEATNAYLPGNGVYPTAASVPGGPCVAGRLQGYVPFFCANPIVAVMPTLNMGAQVTGDGWNTQAHYAVSENCIAPAPLGLVVNIPPFTSANPPTAVCNPGARITVGTDAVSVQALILMRGRPRTGQPACGAFATMFNCIENPTNQAAVLAGNTLLAPFPATVAPSTYMPITTGSNDLLYLFRQRTQ